MPRRALLLLLAAVRMLADGPPPLVSTVDSIGFTVSDLDR